MMLLAEDEIWSSHLSLFVNEQLSESMSVRVDGFFDTSSGAFARLSFEDKARRLTRSQVSM